MSNDPVALVRQAFPTTPIVVFSASDGVALERARVAGAHAWVSKEDSITSLVELVERVGRDPYSGHSTRDIRTVPSPASERWPHLLTPRELQALEGLVSGKNTTELAQWMGVRESTVSTHIQTVKWWRTPWPHGSSAWCPPGCRPPPPGRAIAVVVLTPGPDDPDAVPDQPSKRTPHRGRPGGVECWLW
jgi:hypothetical protein